MKSLKDEKIAYVELDKRRIDSLTLKKFIAEAKRTGNDTLEFYSNKKKVFEISYLESWT